MWKNTTYPLPEFGPYVGSPGNGYMVQCMAYVYCCKQGRILRGEDAAVKGDLAKGIHVKLCQEAQERSEHAPQILCYRRLEDGGLTAVVSSLERQFVIRMVVELLSSAALWQAVFPQ